jgi:hypothetical protein
VDSTNTLLQYIHSIFDNKIKDMCIITHMEVFTIQHKRSSIQLICQLFNNLVITCDAGGGGEQDGVPASVWMADLDGATSAPRRI